MIIHTRNTKYTLIDCGDGGFKVSGNPKFFPKPLMMHLVQRPEVGRPMVMRFKEGEREGHYLRTSTVQSIQEAA